MVIPILTGLFSGLPDPREARVVVSSRINEAPQLFQGLFISILNHIMPDSNSLLVIILDVSPLAWGNRDLARKLNDQRQQKRGKPSAGPAKLEEVVDSVQAFSSAACSIEREAGLIVMGVADAEIAVLYPRKDGE